MKKVYAERHREIDFSRAKRGPVIPLEPGKTKISIRLDNRVLEYFRGLVEKAGGGNYQTLVNDALVAYIEQRSVIEAVRLAVRQELKSVSKGRDVTRRSTGRRTSGARVSSGR